MSVEKKIIYDVKNLNFSYYYGKKQSLHALKDINLTIPEGSFLCLIGPSGSGKTTLLNSLGLIENISEGSILFDSKDFKCLSEKEKCYIRRFKIGFVFQHFHLFPILTAEENVEFFLIRQGVKRSERKRRVKEMLEMVGIWEHRHHKPLEMSGGQCQRVALARALAKKPDVIIADEPTASLDQKTGGEIMDIFLKINKEYGCTIILSSHDPMVHSYVKDFYMLKDGKLCN